MKKVYLMGLILAVSLMPFAAKAAEILLTFEAMVDSVNDPANLSSYFGQQYVVGEAVTGSFTFPLNGTVLSSDSAGVDSGTDYFLAGNAATGNFNVGGDILSANGMGSAVSIQNNSTSGFVGDVYFYSSAVNSSVDGTLGFITLALVDVQGTLFENEDYFELDSLAGIDYGFWIVGGQIGAFDALDRQVLDGFASGLVDVGSIQLASVPEPGTTILLGMGLLGLLVARRKRA